MFKRMYPLLLILIFVVAFLVRFVNLENLPQGLQQDETSIGYNAYSILQTGRDEYGQQFPVYFKAFGEYKLPVYIYTAVIPIALFDTTAFAVRFPSALFGFLTIIAFYFLIKQLVPKEDKYVPIIATVFLAINPWHIHFSRGAFEVTQAVFFMTLGLLLFLKSLKHYTYLLLPLSLFLFVLSMYTYNIARLFAPLFLIFLIFIYRKELMSKSKRIIGFSIIVISLLLLPFIFLFFSNGGVSSTTGTLLFSSAVVQSSILELRTYTVDLPSFIGQLFFNKWELSFMQYIKNVVSYLSVDFFFVSGSPHGNHGIGAMGMFYLFELPLIIAGVREAIKRRSKTTSIIFAWMIGVILVASLTREAPYGTRSLFLVNSAELFSALGLVFFIKQIHKLKTYRVALFALLGVFMTYNVIYFAVLYTQRFPIVYAEQWKAADRELSLFLQENYDNYDRIVIDNETNFIYTSLLYYSTFPPEKFYSTVKRYPDDSEGFSKIKSFGKYEFRTIEWKADQKLTKTLFITKPTKHYENTQEVNTIYYPERTTVFADGQKIIQLPVKDGAYKVFTHESSQ